MNDGSEPVNPSQDDRPLTQDKSRLRRKRAAADLSLRGAADRAGIHWTTIGNLERGARSAEPRTLAALAQAYGCGITDLIPAAHKELVDRFAEEADPDGALPQAEREVRAMNLLADYLEHGEPETNGAAA